jgi:hypothetical protein
MLHRSHLLSCMLTICVDCSFRRFIVNSHLFEATLPCSLLLSIALVCPIELTHTHTHTHTYIHTYIHTRTQHVNSFRGICVLWVPVASTSSTNQMAVSELPQLLCCMCSSSVLFLALRCDCFACILLLFSHSSNNSHWGVCDVFVFDWTES